MQQVWRVENDEGWGPYEWGIARDILGDDAVDRPDPSHVSPWEDNFPKAALNNWGIHGLLSGFVSLAQAKAWFDDATLAKLAKQGFHLKEMQATKVYHGNHQVLFKPVEAKELFTDAG